MTNAFVDKHTAASMEASELAGYRKSIAGLPITLRPAFNGQLAEWVTLFPYERGRLRIFLRGLASMEPSALDSLMQPLRQLEIRMGVDRWKFSQSADTMENASMLARSEFYTEWREQVRRVYAAVDASARQLGQTPRTNPRLVVAILPARLPFDPATVWEKWGNHGVVLSINGDPARLPELLLQGSSSIPALLMSNGTASGDSPSGLRPASAESVCCST